MTRKKQRVVLTYRTKSYRKRGGALTDWIPGYNAAANALSSARDAYNVYRDLTQPVPEEQAPPTPITSTQSYGDFSFLEDGPNFDQGVKFEPIPEPPPAPPVYSWKPTIFPPKKKPTQDLVPAQNNYQPRKPSTIQKIKRIRPVSLIDNTLKTLGIRDKVRGYLSKSELGRLAVKGADYAMKLGFGIPQRRRRCAIKPHGIIYGGRYLAFHPSKKQVQSVVISKQGRFKSLPYATHWVKKQGYHPRKVDIKPHTYRYRLQSPRKFNGFYYVHDPKLKSVKYDVGYGKSRYGKKPKRKPQKKQYHKRR